MPEIRKEKPADRLSLHRATGREYYATGTLSQIISIKKKV
jgi:hypothetical protein